MAIIEKQAQVEGAATGWDISEVCPAGTYVGVCLEVKDTFDVTRPKFEDPSQTEIVNLTRFLFGVQGADGIFYKIQTHDLKISSHEKSSLMAILTAWTAKPISMLEGWDYCEMTGEAAMITVIQKTSQKGRVYATVRSVVAPPAQMAGQAPDPSSFNAPVAETVVAEAAQTPAEAPAKAEAPVEAPQTETTADNSKTESEEPPF